MQPYFEKNEHSVFFYDLQGDNDCSIHFHQNVEIIHMISGCLEITVRGKTKRLLPGECAIASGYEPHGFLTVENSCFEVLIFPADLIPDYFTKTENQMLTTPFLEQGEDADAVAMLIKKMIPYANRKASLTAIGLAYTILGILIEALGLVKKTKYMQEEGVLTKILTYINNHYREELTLSDIADHLGYHKSYLSAIFNHGVGYHFNHYVNMLRVRYARHLINNSTMTLDEISVESGFRYTRSFRRAFMDYYGQTPREYQNRLS